VINVIDNFSRYETTNNHNSIVSRTHESIDLSLEKLDQTRASSATISKVFDLHYPRINGTAPVSKVECSKSEEAVDKSSGAHLKAHQSVHSPFPRSPRHS